MSVTGVSDPYSVSYAYDINNRLLTETKTIAGVNETTDYGYDDNGNQISKGGGTYKYNGFNQLIQVNKDGLTSTYAYDGTGLRTSKTVGETTTAHIWDGDRLAFEIDHTGTVMNSYIRGINLIYSNSGDANNKYYLYNIHGDVTQLTDNAGNVIKDYDYDAFGNERAPDPADTNVFRYSGEYFDKEIGAYYLRARYYDPANSRWLSEDTYWNIHNMIYGDKEYRERERRIPDINAISQSINLYVYCGNNPVIYVDSSGQFFIIPVLVASAPVWAPYVAIGAAAIGSALVVDAVGLNPFETSNSQDKKKPVNLPAFKKLSIDMPHILSGHTPNGNRNPKGNKDIFYGMTAEAVRKAIHEAYESCERIKTQGDRVLVKGFSKTYDMFIEMWVNIKDMIIETAYPK